MSDDYVTLETSAEVTILNAAGFIPTGARVLDLGCGRGDDCIYLAYAGCNCLGIDLSSINIRYARAHSNDCELDGLGSVTFREGDIRDLPRALGRERGPFDFVLDRLVSSNLSNNDASKLFKSVAPLMSQGGIYCLAYGYSTSYAPDGRTERLPNLGISDWFKPLRVRSMDLPDVFNGGIRARRVLVPTLPAKVGNHQTAKLCLLSPRRGVRGTTAKMP